MKVRPSVKRICEDCKVIRREGKVRVICTSIPSTNRFKGIIMARIAGIDLPREKRIEIGLTYIYGIGLPTAQKLLAHAGHQPRHARQRPHAKTTRSDLREAIDAAASRSKATCAVRSQGNIKRLMDIGCYRGLRHRRGLPVRGQRTKTNARTRKGPKRTVAGKKKAAPRSRAGRTHGNARPGMSAGVFFHCFRRSRAVRREMCGRFTVEDAQMLARDGCFPRYRFAQGVAPRYRTMAGRTPAGFGGCRNADRRRRAGDA